MHPVLRLIMYLILVLLLYGTGPMLLAFRRKRPISRKGLIAFSVLYTAAAWLAFSLLRILTLDAGYAGIDTAVMWGIVFYDRSRRILKERGLLYK